MHHADVLRRVADDIEEGTDWTINERGRAYLKERITDKWGERVNYRPFDSSYKCIIGPHFEEFLNHIWVQQREYLSNVHDCDDFSKHLWTTATVNGFNGVAMVVNGQHAFNAVVYPGPREPDLVEPQIGRIVTEDRGDEYSLDGATFYF